MNCVICPVFVFRTNSLQIRPLVLVDQTVFNNNYVLLRTTRPHIDTCWLHYQYQCKSLSVQVKIVNLLFRYFNYVSLNVVNMCYVRRTQI